MKYTITNANYSANVVKLEAFVPIPNKDKIQGTLIFSNHVIVSKDCNFGDVGIFFPVGSKINFEFLKANNLLKDSELNTDIKQKGFFEKSGRVKALRLGGVKSEGFWIPIKSISNFFKPEDFKVGDEFNSIDGIDICSKYIIEKQVQEPRTSNEKKKAKLKRFNQIIDNQFNFHIDTPLLNKNVHVLKPDDIISITNKLHGTSAIFCNVMVNRKLSAFEKILNWFKVNIVKSQYGNIYSSRSVIKNHYLTEDKNVNHFYDEDIWGAVNNKIKSQIPKAFTVYGEIVGYTSTGSMIQKGYHYGCDVNTHKFYVYRVTITNPDGLVVDLSWGEIKDFCLKYGFTHVPEFYYGYAKDCFKDIVVDENWNVEFLKRLSLSYNMNDSMCVLNDGKVPAEGLVLRIDNLFRFSALKLKNFAFKLRESKELDDGIIDLETQESQGSELES